MNSINTKAHTDIKRLVWIEEYLPEKARPYAYLMRIDRPVGIWLLLLPGLWGITLASGGLFHLGLQELYFCALFIIGAIVMRGAGCVVNDLWDRDLDKMVERTKNRPLASGTISTTYGLVFLATLSLIGLIILLQFNLTTIMLGFLAVPLIISYPLMKRITWWPQAFLGLTFNFGTLMGWSAVTGELQTAPLLLYFAGLFWTLGYDTIYAHQDKEDDILAGIKSTALALGKNSKLWITVFYALCIFFVILARVMAHKSSFTIVLILLPAAHFIWQLKKWAPDDAQSSLFIFKSNTMAGLLILLALAV